jgi:hypothetical protein
LPNSRSVVEDDLLRIPLRALKNHPGIVLCVSVLLASCAAKPAPLQINCVTLAKVSGHVHLVPCSRQASNPVQLDDAGSGVTSACPKDNNVELVVIRDGQPTFVLPDQVHVQRSGDGIAVAIDADLQ